jgi:hypothetical protein
VIDASGRRSPIDRWLAEIGARPAASWRAECGIAYFSRHYRLRPAAELPGPAATRAVAGLDEFTVGIWGGDNGAMQLAVAPLAADRRFRTLRNPDVFTAVLRMVPAYAAWLDVLDPISGVFPMAGLRNTMRRLVTDKTPVATGLHAIGDSVCTTNPTFGRGLSLALSGAADLRDVISNHGAGWTEQALALDRLAGEHIVPFYEDQAAVDLARLGQLRQTILGAPSPDPRPAGADRITYAQLRAAALVDPTAFRGFWKVMGMICEPDVVYTDPDVVACTLQSLKQHPSGQPISQLSREQLTAALAG